MKGVSAETYEDRYAAAMRAAEQRFAPLAAALKQHGFWSEVWQTGGMVICLHVPLVEGGSTYALFSEHGSLDENAGFGVYHADADGELLDDEMSRLLDDLIRERRQASIEYKQYLDLMANFGKRAVDPGESADYPSAINTPGRRAIFDLFDQDEGLAITIDGALRGSCQDGWRENRFKTRPVRQQGETRWVQSSSWCRLRGHGGNGASRCARL